MCSNWTAVHALRRIRCQIFMPHIFYHHNSYCLHNTQQGGETDFLTTSVDHRRWPGNFYTAHLCSFLGFVVFVGGGVCFGFFDLWCGESSCVKKVFESCDWRMVWGSGGHLFSPWFPSWSSLSVTHLHVLQYTFQCTLP